MDAFGASCGLRGFNVARVVVEERYLRPQVHILAKELFEFLARSIRQEIALQVKSAQHIRIAND